MQYLKQIKGNLSKKLFDQNAQNKNEEIKKEKVQQKKQSKMTLLAKTLFNKLGKNQDQKDIKHSQKLEDEIQAPVLIDGRIWMTSQIPAKLNGDSLKQQIQVKQLVVNQQDAAEFVSNICNFQACRQKQKLMRRNKAKNEIFGKLEIEPIYLQQNSISKIMKMQFQDTYAQLCSDKCKSLIQRTHELVIERDTIDRSIEQVLTSGYLWKANQVESCNIVDLCYSTISNSRDNVNQLLGEIQKVRANFKYFIAHYSKASLLNRRKVELIRKIKLIKKISLLRKDICQSFQNLDQAFHIERDRQKLYKQLSDKPIISQKLVVTKNLLTLTRKRNTKICDLIESILVEWIDRGKKLQEKSIQKLLIMVYFIRNQKMYKENKLIVDLSKIKNKNGLVKQLIKVRSWESYRYVNDKSVKQNVSLFIEQLIKELNKTSLQVEKQKQDLDLAVIQNKIIKLKQNKNDKEKVQKSENIQF